jgi:hypothetical protein
VRLLVISLDEDLDAEASTVGDASVGDAEYVCDCDDDDDSVGVNVIVCVALGMRVRVFCFVSDRVVDPEASVEFDGDAVSDMPVADTSGDWVMVTVCDVVSDVEPLSEGDAVTSEVALATVGEVEIDDVTDGVPDVLKESVRLYVSWSVMVSDVLIVIDHEWDWEISIVADPPLTEGVSVNSDERVCDKVPIDRDNDGVLDSVTTLDTDGDAVSVLVLVLSTVGEEV